MTAPTIAAAITADWRTVTLSPAAVALLATGDATQRVAVEELHTRTAYKATLVLSTAARRLRAAPQHWMREARLPMTRVEFGAAVGELDAAVAMLRGRPSAHVGVQGGEVPRG